MRKTFLLLLFAVVVCGCSTDFVIWIPRSKSADPLYRFVKGDKAGYIDADGNVAIPPSLPVLGNYGSEFHDGLLEIAVSDGRYVDLAGRVVVDPGLFRGWDFSEGLAVAMRKDEKLWGFIDTSGKFAISPRFQAYAEGSVHSFSDGLARIETHGKTGFIDHTGAFVIKPEFLDGADFSDGAARVVAEGPCVYIPDGACADVRRVGLASAESPTPCKFAYIDKGGQLLGQMRFDSGRDFSEGLAPVRMGRLWGFIDKSGSLTIAPKFEDAMPFSSGLARVRERGLYGYADHLGATVISAKFKYAEPFSEGLAAVSDGNQSWYIDGRGERAIAEEFAVASPFFKGLAHVRLLGGGFAYIDTRGRRVFSY